METTLTSGNLQSFLRLLDEKGACPGRVTRVLASGMLADLFDKGADLSHREAVRAALKLPSLVSSSLVVLKTVELPAFRAKKTAKCMQGDIYGYRDADIDRLLPQTQPACATSKVAIVGRSERQTFADMFRAALKLAPDAPLDVIGRLLKARGHVVGLQQDEFLIEKQESGEDVGLRTDGYAAFAPVLDKDGNVCVLNVNRYGDRWHRDVDPLGDGHVWNPEYRLVLGNSDALAL